MPLSFEASSMVLLFHFRWYGHGRIGKMSQHVRKEVPCESDNIRHSELKMHRLKKKKKKSAKYTHPNCQPKIQALDSILLHYGAIFGHQMLMSSHSRVHNLLSLAWLHCLL